MQFSPTIPYVPLKFHIFPYIPYHHVNEIENSHYVTYGSLYANSKILSNLTQNSEIVVGPKSYGTSTKHLKPYSLNILIIIFKKLVEIRKNVKP